MSESGQSLNPVQETIDYAKKRGRLELLTGLLGISNLKHTTQQNQMNQEAENAFVRKKAWECEGSPEGSEEMQQTVLGDLQTTTHITNQPSSIGKLLLGAGLLATGVGTSIGGYLVADAIKNKPVPIVQEAPEIPKVEDTDTDSVIEWSLE